ncbi:hypothetical protein L596_021545 [Steinernema carpocapsae]|uniref:Uncharacterized protein n=1 Tax=Steinernema carpocapsae TaxID=34508 RepID=A0A4U5MJ42_STECR|nr:hypothetical protein L596_021545 [Steinernema carpocapsae]
MIRSLITMSPFKKKLRRRQTIEVCVCRSTASSSPSRRRRRQQHRERRRFVWRNCRAFAFASSFQEDMLTAAASAAS